jgi:transposase
MDLKLLLHGASGVEEMRRDSRDLNIIALLNGGRNVEEIAFAVGCSTATVYRVLASDPDFSSQARRQDRNQIIMAMCKQGHDIQRIITAVGCSQATVYRVLASNPRLRAGPRYPSRLKNKRDRRIMAMYRQDRLLSEIAERVHCSRNTVQNVITRVGSTQADGKTRKISGKGNNRILTARKRG